MLVTNDCILNSDPAAPLVHGLHYPQRSAPSVRHLLFYQAPELFFEAAFMLFMSLSRLATAWRFLGMTPRTSPPCASAASAMEPIMPAFREKNKSTKTFRNMRFSLRSLPPPKTTPMPCSASALPKSAALFKYLCCPSGWNYVKRVHPSSLMLFLSSRGSLHPPANCCRHTRKSAESASPALASTSMSGCKFRKGFPTSFTHREVCSPRLPPEQRLGPRRGTRRNFAGGCFVTLKTKLMRNKDNAHKFAAHDDTLMFKKDWYHPHTLHQR